MTNKRINQKHTCQQCGKTFQPFRASKGFYCSNKCKFIASKIERVLTCENCKKTYTNNKRITKYCSNACYQQHKLNRSLEERLFPLIEKTDYCWIWKGNINKQGYGRVHYKGRNEFVHRLMFELATGEDITNLFVRHFICDNPPCCNPAHLRSGTKADNSQDMVNHKRHSHGETSYAKLTEADVRKIRQDKRTHQEIAADYGVDRKTIGNAINGVTWKHIK